MDYPGIWFVYIFYVAWHNISNIKTGEMCDFEVEYFQVFHGYVLKFNLHDNHFTTWLLLYYLIGIQTIRLNLPISKVLLSQFYWEEYFHNISLIFKLLT